MIPDGLIVSATGSGTGKTTLTLGLLRAFRRAGVVVRPFKAGPDYIDPGFHHAASGMASANLDSWAMPAGLMGQIIATAQGADLVIAEGAMGLFDGVAAIGATARGTAADLSALTGWPVVLVIDASGQAQSVGAVALGFARLRADVRVAGVVVNRVASPRHEAMVREGLAAAAVPCLGCLPRVRGLEMPSRHLGLVQASERSELETQIDAMADLVTAHLDLAQIRELAAPTQCPAGDGRPVPPPGQRIALAQDQAFSFLYPHLVTGWRAAGAEIMPFSPLADEAPDPSADCVWLPGGYPELHAGRLAANGRFLAGLTALAGTRPVHGECGGYMVLGQGLVDKDGHRHQMAGLLGLETSYAARKMHLGYRLATLAAPIPGLAAGQKLRGHEFHFSTILAQPDLPLAEVVDAAGASVVETGSRRGYVSGTFFHLISEVA
ncbi:cobyrinate a,c-diamide synthase [Thioclava litoralis]|uniref:Hydrogenobyrinate a,c-diamide synthase n=1 Tax=Thioclava litoralis TaxID=3076557 RepID=A0ABZ1DZM7_9RHOB|nr:cobyrinate a,c-diamide synthase [Thioclava sp. FTW29]